MRLPPNFLDIEQHKQAWFDARLGSFTASRAAHIGWMTRNMNGKKIGEETAARAKYRLELACERITQKPSDHYVSEWMERGNELEAAARASYEALTRSDVQIVGFACHPTIKMAGASPDGIVAPNKLVQFKCPKRETHIAYIVGNKVPKLYVPQKHWELACAGDWAEDYDFVTYCPEMPPEYQTFIIPAKRDADEIAKMEAEVKAFLCEVEETVALLNERIGKEGDYYADRLQQSIAQARAKRVKRGPQLVVEALGDPWITEEDMRHRTREQEGEDASD